VGFKLQPYWRNSGGTLQPIPPNTSVNLGTGLLTSGGLSIGGVTCTSITTGTADNDKLVTEGYVNDQIGAENLWDRTGTTLEPHNANDNINIGSGNFTSTGSIFIDAINTTNGISMVETTPGAGSPVLILKDGDGFNLTLQHWAGGQGVITNNEAGGPIYLRPSGVTSNYHIFKTVGTIQYIGRLGDDDLLQLENNLLTINGTLTATTVTGANVTTGLNPGHTHSSLDASDGTPSSALSLAANGDVSITNNFLPSSTSKIATASSPFYAIDLEASTNQYCTIRQTSTVNTANSNYPLNIILKGNGSAATTGVLHQVDIKGYNSTPAKYVYVKLSADSEVATAGNESGEYRIIVANGGTLNDRGRYTGNLDRWTFFGEVYMPDVYNDTVGAVRRDLQVENSGKLGYIVSSERYKENIVDADIDTEANKIFSIPMKRFDYKDATLGTGLTGTTAELLDTILPEVVSYEYEKEAVTKIDENGKEYTVDEYKLDGESKLIKTLPETYSRTMLVDYLICAVQNLNNRIQALEV
jgi:hypothetical protein